MGEGGGFVPAAVVMHALVVEGNERFEVGASEMILHNRLHRFRCQRFVTSILVEPKKQTANFCDVTNA